MVKLKFIMKFSAFPFSKYVLSYHIKYTDNFIIIIEENMFVLLVLQ